MSGAGVPSLLSLSGEFNGTANHGAQGLGCPRDGWERTRASVSVAVVNGWEGSRGGRGVRGAHPRCGPCRGRKLLSNAAVFLFRLIGLKGFMSANGEEVGKRLWGQQLWNRLSVRNTPIYYPLVGVRFGSLV